LPVKPGVNTLRLPHSNNLKKLVGYKHSSFLPLRQCRRRKSFMTLTLGRRGQHWPELYGIDGQAEANPENPV